jgi:hypothetical protein
MPESKKSTTPQFPPAAYGSIVNVASTDRDVYLSFFQPLPDNEASLVARLAIPMKTAKELKDILEKHLNKISSK